MHTPTYIQCSFHSSLFQPGQLVVTFSPLHSKFEFNFRVVIVVFFFFWGGVCPSESDPAKINHSSMKWMIVKKYK